MSDAEFIFGAIIKESLADEIEITLVATGFDSVPEDAIPLKTPGAEGAFSKRTDRKIDVSSWDDDIDVPFFIKK